MSTTDTLRDWALYHAALGWHVFPVAPGRNKPPAFPDHPADRCDRRDPWCRTGHVTWEVRATTDPDRIRRAWSAAPYNIGLACGPSRLVVVDLDTTDGRGRPGELVLAELAAERGVTVPATYTVGTPSGGRHLYFTTPPGVLGLRNTSGALGENIDTRSNGGYVLGAGSTRPDGGYELVDDTDPAELPAWMVQALLERASTATTAAAVRVPVQPGAYAAAALRGEAERVSAAPRGEHNAVLSTAAWRIGQLVGAGLLDPDTARTQLRVAAKSLLRADCDCTPREVDRVIEAGLTAGSRRPRHLTERPVA
jgi:hypothetical protein